MEFISLFEEFDPTIKPDNESFKKLVKTIKFLEGKKKILFLTTSNRGDYAVKELDEVPKSTQLARILQDYLGHSKCDLIEVPELKIYRCEGNVSHREGNSCGVKAAKLADKKKNPSGNHRCWASFNNEDDELWKISSKLLEADAVVFWGSVRWGQMNSLYQKLIERLTWLENRHSTLKESNLLKGISAGLICVGQNWRGKEVIEVQKEVLKFFGFDVQPDLSWNWQFTLDKNDEKQSSYKKSGESFDEAFHLD
jgi:multimeric flavodoxin WrbA